MIHISISMLCYLLIFEPERNWSKSSRNYIWRQKAPNPKVWSHVQVVACIVMTLYPGQTPPVPVSGVCSTALSLEIEAVPLCFWCNLQFNARQSSVICRVVKWYTGYFDNVFREPRLYGTDWVWVYSWEKRLQKAWRIGPFNLQKAYLYLIQHSQIWFVSRFLL